MQKLISVITPVHNAAKTLSKCIDSIRCQSYQCWEHIIVDDGSTDESCKLLSDLSVKDPRIKVLRQNKLGPAGARNTAISIAQGEYIALLDADDYSLPDRLAIQIDFMETHKDVDLLGAAIFNVSTIGRDLGVNRLPEKHEELVRNIYRACPFYTSTVMARANFFSVLGGFDVALRRAQDYDLWLRGYPQFRYHNLQVPLTYYCRRLPTFQSAFYSAMVLCRAAKREGKLLSHGWYAVRPFLAILRDSIQAHILKNHR